MKISLAGKVLLTLLFSSIAAEGQVFSDFSQLAESKDFQALRVSSNNPDPESNDDSKRPIPGETIVLADLTGPGMITHIWITVAAFEYGWPRLLRLRVYYDGSSTPSVDSPLGDFFAVGHGMERPLNSLMVRNSSDGRSRNGYWPMPFLKSCKITLTNEGRERVSNFYYHIDWQKRKSLPPNIGYFHARYRQKRPEPKGRPYEFLSVQGKGHYVGTVLSVVQTEPGWFGEGDEFFYVDGNQKPSIEGTGTEDYFNDAWGLRISEGPYTGVPVAEDGTRTGARLTAYRWHLLDPIPFEHSLRFEIETAGWTYNADGTVRSGFEGRSDLFSSVAFWYQQGIAQGLPQLPYGAARVPHGNARQVEVERSLDRTKMEGGSAEVLKEAFWSRDLLLFRAKGIGSKILIPIDIEEDGLYEILAQVAHSSDYGEFTTLLDGKPLGALNLEHEPGANMVEESRLNLYHTELYVAENHLLGWEQLSKGPHIITFVCTGKDSRSSNYYLGIDTLILSKVASFPREDNPRADELRRIGEQGLDAISSIDQFSTALADRDDSVREAAAWGLTQLGDQASKAISQLVLALDDPDHVVRGLAAIALRNAGTSSESALSKLIVKLKDENPNVRMMAAQAIERQGKAAIVALPALITACQVEGEQVHVLRSLAVALGAIGPEASPALPVLQKLQAHPRIRWSANAAIRNITGKSVSEENTGKK